MAPGLLAASANAEAADSSASPARSLNSVTVRDKLRSLNSRHASDLARANAIRSGDQAQAVRFIKDVSAIVWNACRLLAHDDAEARSAFSEAMATLTANRFARLSAYAGRGTLATFVALTVRELLAERMMRFLQSDGTRAWRAFEHLFEADIIRLIRKRLPDSGEDSRRDAYQDICLALVENDYKRIRCFSGNGSFAGFLLRTVDHLLIDIVRSTVPRRRLPASIARLSTLDQEVFKLVFWRGTPDRADVLAELLRSRIGYTPEPADISAALQRVRAAAPPARVMTPKCVTVDHIEGAACEHEPSPEERIIHADDDQRLAAAMDALGEAMTTLTPAEQLYLRIALSGSCSPPAREIARLMQRPVEEIYKLKQRVLLRLREIAASDTKIKTWRASV
jgi:RNA polymerase primary sigma factor